MDRSKIIRGFYKIKDIEAKPVISVCDVCGGEMKGNHVGNLERHLKRHHEKELEAKIKEQENEAQTKRKEQKQFTQTKFKKRKVELELSQEELWEYCFDMVTKDGKPFQIVESAGVGKLLKKLCKAVSPKMVINRQNLADKLKERAKEIRQRIGNELKNKMFSLKVDVATHHSRSFLGVNVQYINLKKKKPTVTLRTLGCVELKESATAEYVKELIENVFEKYNLHLAQVYSLTTDNGKNLIKCSKLISQALNIDEENNGDGGSDNDNQTADVIHVDESCESETESLTDFEEDNEDGDEDEDEDGSNMAELDDMTALLMVAVEDFARNENISIGIRCVNHLQHLAVCDSLKMKKSVMAKIRKVVKKLRTPSLRNLLKKEKLKMAILDVGTRWGSTFAMLERLIILKSFCKNHEDEYKELRLSPDEWKEVEDLAKALKPSFIASKMFQRQQMPITDVIRRWLKCEHDTSQIDTPFAKELVSNLSNRGKSLYTNRPVLAALYLDPRFQFLLDEEQKETARIHLETLYRKLNLLQEEDKETGPDSAASSTSTAVQKHSESSQDSFEIALQKRRQEMMRKTGEENSTLIRKELLKFDNVESIGVKDDILEFWAREAASRPELAKLAAIIFAVPCSQSSVERLFSHLRYVFHYTRTSLTDKHLDDIMVVRLYYVNFKESEQGFNIELEKKTP